MVKNNLNSVFIILGLFILAVLLLVLGFYCLFKPTKALKLYFDICTMNDYLKWRSLGWYKEYEKTKDFGMIWPTRLYGIMSVFFGVVALLLMYREVLRY